MALPNPNDQARVSGEQLLTLKDLLHFQEETNKWSQNTDINTFRGQVESQKGFEDLKEGINANTTGIVASMKQNLPNMVAFADGLTKSIGEGLQRSVNVFTKPFKTLTADLNGKMFSDFGDTFSASSEKVNAGLKELTNGLGTFGPVINSFKTALFKTTAAFNVFTGLLGMIVGGLGRIFKPKDLEADRALQIRQDEDVMAAQKEIDEANETLKKPKDFVAVTFIEGTKEHHQNTQVAVIKALKHQGLGDKDSKNKNFSNVRFNKEKKKHEDNYQKNRKDALEALSKAELKKKKAVAAAGEKFDKKWRNTRLVNEMKFFIWRTGAFIASLLPLGILVGGLIIAFKLLKDKLNIFGENFDKEGSIFAGIAAGLRKVTDPLISQLTKVGEKLLSGFKILGQFFTKIGKFIGVGGAEAAEQGTKKAAQKVATEAGKKTALKTTARIAGKAAAPLAGVVDGALDNSAQNEKFARIKNAYDNQIPIMPVDPANPEGEKRPMTPAEFEQAKQANADNKAGSIGKGVGSATGALAGAATGAAIGSVIPVVGTAIGGFLGAVVGSIYGGRAGDNIATNLANDSKDITDPQEYIDMLATNAPELASAAGQELDVKRVDMESQKMADAGGSSSSSTTVLKGGDTSSTTHLHETPVSDQQADYSYGVVGAR